MKVTSGYIESMEKRGFYVANGAAVLGDVVAVFLTQPFEQHRALVLKTPESVSAFNEDTDNQDWTIFRKWDSEE